MKSEKILTCKEEIKPFLGNISDYMFRKYISLGMPARYDGREWIAHTVNIDKWFEIYTRVNMKKALEGIPENGTQGEGECYGHEKEA